MQSQSSKSSSVVRRVWPFAICLWVLGLAWPPICRASDDLTQSGEQQVAAEQQNQASYILGPGDELSVWALNADEITSRPIRIATDGYISLPLIGRIKASGLTVSALEVELTKRLKNHIRDPEVSLTLTEFRSQPVSVLGSVSKPGIHQLKGRKTLIEVLSLAEGVRSDAGHSVTIVRQKEWGRLPLATAHEDPTGTFTVGTVNLKAIVDARSPSDNILIKPHDVISVPRADMIYVIGEVAKAGGFVLQERERLTVLEALSLAGGLSYTASSKHSRILRRASSDSQRVEVPVNLPRILDGIEPDVGLQPDDILFIPNSKSKSAAMRTLDVAIQLGTGIVIWRR